jgi:cyclase
MKKRIIPSVLLRGGTNVVISQKFKPWRTVGALAQQLRLHVRRQCDEILIVNLDLAGSLEYRASERILSLVRQEVDIPISYAGGIFSPAHAASCINAGFDKVYVTSGFLDSNKSVASIVSIIGSQSVGVCLPYKRPGQESSPIVWDCRERAIRSAVAIDLFDAIDSAIESGVGEILLYNVDRDGSLQGLDISIARELDARGISIPVLLAGGAGAPVHFSEALSQSVIQGVVAGTVFSLTQETPSTIRIHCTQSGIRMRRP